MAASTGSSRLDAVLEGGLPSGRAMVVSGGPGAGKSTFAMQFLQAGLSTGEAGLFVSTDQRPEAVRSSFAAFDFDLDHPDLTIVSLQARADDTLVTEEPEDAGAARPADSGFSVPFEYAEVADYLTGLGDFDRVAFDSVSGLSAIDGRLSVVRYLVLNLIRLFTADFEATTLLTAEDAADPTDGSSYPLARTIEFAANGALHFSQTSVRGERRRRLQVTKLRGVDHRTHAFEYVIDEGGIKPVAPGPMPPERSDEPFVTTGSPSIDDFCGGGLPVGDSIVVEFDEKSLVDPFVVQLASGAVDEDMAVWLISPPILTASRFDALLPPTQDPVADLLASDRLHVLDLFSGWDGHADSPNVYQVPANRLLRRLVRTSGGLAYAKHVIRSIDDQRGDRPVFAPVYTDAFSHLLDELELVHELYYWAREAITLPRDTALFVHNPDIIDGRLAASFRTEARQLFRLASDETGLQYLTLEKSSIGQPGGTAVVDYDDQISVSPG